MRSGCAAFSYECEDAGLNSEPGLGRRAEALRHIEIGAADQNHQRFGVNTLRGASYTATVPRHASIPGAAPTVPRGTQGDNGFFMYRYVVAGSYPFAIAIALASAIFTGCSKSAKPQAPAGQDVSRPVTVWPVRQGKLLRSVRDV